jgi:hypothetical protein
VFSLANLSSLVLCLRVRLEPTQVKVLKSRIGLICYRGKIVLITIDIRAETETAPADTEVPETASGVTRRAEPDPEAGTT